MAIMLLQNRAPELLQEVAGQLDKHPDSIELHHKKLNILMLEERFEEARDVLRELILLKPNSIAYPLQLLNLYAREEQYPLVIKELKVFERDFPDHPELLYIKARALKEMAKL